MQARKRVEKRDKRGGNFMAELFRFCGYLVYARAREYTSLSLARRIDGNSSRGEGVVHVCQTYTSSRMQSRRLKGLECHGARARIRESNQAD